MGRWRSKKERLRLGKTVACLRDAEGLKWQQISERLGLNGHTVAIAYYKTYKEALLNAKVKTEMEEIKEFAGRIGIDYGWIWLYENGCGHRVPEEIKERIEEAKLKDAFERKEA